MLKKGIVSIEFIFCIILILISLSIFITINLNFKEKLSENFNLKQVNDDLCFLKKIIIEKNNGEYINDICLKKERVCYNC